MDTYGQRVRTTRGTLVNQYFGANQVATFWITGDLKPDRLDHLGQSRATIAAVWTHRPGNL